ncbi:hypothetical protein ZIOFF_067616 [Zingiber officinale]|uniref:Uncharacterized protein n=1 Tax=Zingiber officinale TaxID=94328 RepID=A0A8J5CFU0_ZINOF|nr:hypothetical protein ZIOFF_067616 [Zingiber officinale]
MAGHKRKLQQGVNNRRIRSAAFGKLELGHGPQHWVISATIGKDATREKGEVDGSGMGTKVHCKSYLPGFQPPGDLNEDSNFSWTLFCEHKSIGRQLYNDFQPRGVGSCLEYDKDMLKRTMLEHEAIFQNQVYELHRVYRIQKELMHELKKTQMNRYCQTSNSSMLVSRLRSELDEKGWLAPHQPLMTKPNVIQDSEDDKVSLHFLNKDMTPSKHGKCVESDKPEETEPKKFTGRILDLHLPADVYIEKEVTEKIERENVHGIEAENGVKLTLGSIDIHGFRKGCLKSNWDSDDQSVHSLADLNEPITESWENEAVNSNTHKLDGVNVLSKELEKPCLLTESESKTKFPHIYLSNNDGANSLDAETVGIIQEQQTLNDCAGQSIADTNECPSSSEQLKLKFDKSEENYLLEQDEIRTWFREKTICIENSANPGLPTSLNNPRLKASQVTPLSAAYPPAPACTKPMQIIGQPPVSLQALPCFKSYNGYSQPHRGLDNLILSHTSGHRHAIQMNLTSLANIQHLQSNLGKSNLSDSNGSSPYESSQNHELQRPFKDSKSINFESLKGLNLNQAILCGTQDGFADQENLVRKHEEAPDKFIWPREWSSCNGHADRKENDTRSNVHFNAEFRGLEIKSLDADLASNLGKGKGFRNCSQGLESEINLNCEVIPVTENKLCEASTEGIPSSLPMAAAVGKLACQIDLEVPADELEDNDMDVYINQPIAAAVMSAEKISSLDVCIKSAADAIISMSIDAHNHLDNITSIPSAPATCDSLHLLAKIATCIVESFEASGDDGLDFFESMTLKLDELKADEFSCKSFKHEKPKDDEKSTCSMLSRSRRAQAKKRTQRRDFKKDVLPALTSLSKHEVTEDLQVLGGITRASKLQLTGSTKTKRSKHKTSSQRGRRQARSLAIAIAEMHNSPPRTLPIHTELENARSSIMGWGRTTRRCPRQRTANAAAP